MKRLLFIISFLLLGVLTFGQSATQIGFVGKFTFQGFAAGGSSDVTGTLDAFSDQTNQYFANNIQVGDIAWDNQGNRWEVMAVNSSNLLQADVDLRSINGGGTPLGVGFVSRETPTLGLSLFVPDNNIGISQQLKSRIESHNMLLIDQYIAANQDSVFTGATAADTSTIANPAVGDVLVAVDGSTSYYDGDNWVVNTGGGSGGTWLKPEMEGGNTVVIDSEEYLGFSNSAGDELYIGSGDIAIYGADGAELSIFSKEIQIADGVDGELRINPDSIRGRDLDFVELGNFNFNTDQDTTGLEGYVLGLNGGEIGLVDGGNLGTWLKPEWESGNVQINPGFNQLVYFDDFFGFENSTTQSPGSVTYYTENADREVEIIAGIGATFRDNGSGQELEVNPGGIISELMSQARLGHYDFLVNQDTSGLEGYRLGLDNGKIKLLAGAGGSADGNGIYSGSGNVPSGTEATLADGGSFTIKDFSGSDRLRITEDANVAITATTGFTATTTDGILGLTHTGSSGQLIVQSQDERATFQGEEARVIGDTLARMTSGTGDVTVKDALADISAGTDFATLDGSINEFRVGTHDIVFEGTDGFYPEWKFQTPVAANDWRMWTGPVGLTLQNGTGGNTLVVANNAAPSMTMEANGDVKLIQYDDTRHDIQPAYGHAIFGENGEIKKAYDGEFNYKDDGTTLINNTNTVIINNTTVTLPDPANNQGKVFMVIANSSTSGGATRTINVINSGTIEGNASLTMDNAYEVYALVSDGTEYIILWNKP